MLATGLISTGLGLAGSMGAFGGPKQYGFSSGDISAQLGQRQGQINDFANDLATMRAKYLAQIPGLNTATFNQFGNNAAANFGAKGLTAQGGAFQSALAREALPLQVGMYNKAYTSGVANASEVNSARAGAFNGAIGAESSGLSQPTRNGAWGGLINAGANLGLAAFGQYENNKTPSTTPADPYGRTSTFSPASNPLTFAPGGWGNVMGSTTGPQLPRP